MNIHKKYLVCALVCGFIVRFIFFMLIHPDNSLLTSSDQGIYIQLSEVLMENGFGFEFGSERMPLYPLFLSAARMINNNLFFVLFIQDLLSLISIYFVYKTGSLFSARIGIIAAILAALSLNITVYSNQILTEALFVPLFYSFVYVILKYTKTNNLLDIVKGSILLGICTLIRPLIIYLPFLLFIFIILISRYLDIKKRIGFSLVFILLFILTISPWIYRNYTVYNYPGLYTQSGVHLIGWCVPEVARYDEGIDLSAAIEKYDNLWKDELNNLPEEVRNNPFLVDREARSFAVERLRSASLLSVVKAWTGGAVKNIIAPVTVELAYIFEMEWSHFTDAAGSSIVEQAINFLFFNENKIYSFLLITGILFTFIFRLVQLIGSIMFFQRDEQMFIASFVIIAYFLAVNGPIGYAKYRLPFEIILIICTAIFADRFINRVCIREDS